MKRLKVAEDLQAKIQGRRPRMIDEMEQCRWCLRLVPKGDLKTVRIIKWKDETTRGIRRICSDCRWAIKGEYELVENNET